MTRNLSASPRADHRDAARRARTVRGEWILAHVYRHVTSADAMARNVVRARGLAAYLPAGAFEAYGYRHADGGALWIRYVEGEEPVPDLPETMTVRVRYDGDGPGYEGVGILTVTVRALCPQCGGPRGTAIRPHVFRADGDTFEVDVWDNPCGHVDMYDAIVREARRFEASRSLPAAAPAPEVSEPVRLLIEAADARQIHHAKTAAHLLTQAGHTAEAEAVLAEVKARHGHMSARQAIAFLSQRPAAEGTARTARGDR